MQGDCLNNRPVDIWNCNGPTIRSADTIWFARKKIAEEEKKKREEDMLAQMKYIFNAQGHIIICHSIELIGIYWGYTYFIEYPGAKYCLN